VPVPTSAAATALTVPSPPPATSARAPPAIAERTITEVCPGSVSKTTRAATPAAANNLVRRAGKSSPSSRPALGLIRTTISESDAMTNHASRRGWRGITAHSFARRSS
jgi:hypothetical protein